MKIFIISQGIPSETAPLNGIFAWDQAVALKKIGHEVSVMALDFRREKDRPQGKLYYKSDGINIFQYSLYTGIYRRLLPILGRICERVFHDMLKTVGSPDIIHSHFYFMGAILASMPSFRKCPYCPVVITEHSSKMNKPASLISCLDKRLSRKAYNYAHMVVAVSSALSKKIEENFSITPLVIPDMFNLPEPKNIKEKKSDSYRILSVGRLVEGKGFSELIDAFYMADLPNSKLIIIGDGSLRSVLESKVKDDRVVLMGMQNREEIVRQLYMANLFALLSHSETFGVSYLEALSMGVPVLGTMCGGPEDFINESNGVLVPVGDVKAASSAMINMYFSKYDSEKMKNDAIEKYSAEAVARELEFIYNSLLSCFFKV